MMKYVVCGTNVEDVEAGIKAMKMAIANGATCGVGGSTMAEAEKGLEAMKQMTAPKGCPCPCSRSISGRELLNMIENANNCSAIADGEVWLHSCEDEDEEVEIEVSGYVAKVRGYESDILDTPEMAMDEALTEGFRLCEIEIFKADLDKDGDLVLNEQVYPL